MEFSKILSWAWWVVIVLVLIHIILTYKASELGFDSKVILAGR